MLRCGFKMEQDLAQEEERPDASAPVSSIFEIASASQHEQWRNSRNLLPARACARTETSLTIRGILSPCIRVSIHRFFKRSFEVMGYRYIPSFFFASVSLPTRVSPNTHTTRRFLNDHPKHHTGSSSQRKPSENVLGVFVAKVDFGDAAYI